MPKRNAKAESAQPAFDLRAARESRSLSQESAAEILCTHQTSIARWERDGNMPRVYRKLWELHWKLEDANAKKKPVRARKPVAASVHAAD